jgi:hypothetical protein
MANGATTPSSTNDAAYTPPGLAVAAALAEAAAAADAAAAGTATPGGTAAAAATGRPRRVIRPPERLINSAVMAGGGDKDDHDMVRCDMYSAGPPGSGAAGVQPFRVQVAPL